MCVEERVDAALAADADDIAPPSVPIPQAHDVAPEPPKSHFSVSPSGAHHATTGRLAAARAQPGSWPCTRYDQRGSPIFRSNATTDRRRTNAAPRIPSKKPPWAA